MIVYHYFPLFLATTHFHQEDRSIFPGSPLSTALSTSFRNEYKYKNGNERVDYNEKCSKQVFDLSPLLNHTLTDITANIPIGMYRDKINAISL